MKKISQLIACALVLCVVAVSVSSLIPQRADAAPGPTQVQVVNTASSPVPVNGSVNASVTGSVAVSGTVGLAAGATVGLAPGTEVGLAANTSVGVTNVGGNPLQVQDLGDGRQPAKGFAGCFFNGVYCIIDIATVPPGFRLVIEHISGSINTGGTLGGVVVGAAYLACCILSNDDYLAPEFMPGSSTVSQVNHQTLMFFDQGQTVRILIGANQVTTGASNFSYSGYLIPN